MEWKRECTEASGTLVAEGDDLRKSQYYQIELIFADARPAAALLVQAFRAAVEAHWETENHMGWNERQRTCRERELVYEISWIAELGVWWYFLQSKRKVQG